MAKKKSAAPKKGKPKSKGKAKTKARGPRQPAFAGMDQIRDTKLDELCEVIGDTRDKLNELRTDEVADERAALKRMRERNLTSYRHAGVELARVPGEEKLRVRTSKDKATAETPSDAGDAGDQVDDDSDQGDDEPLAEGAE